MASPEELIPSLPDTLPEDFGEWDGESAATATAVDSGKWETAQALSEAPKSFGQSSDSDAAAVARHQEDVSNGKSEAAPTAKTLSSREEWEAWIESHSFNESPKTSRVVHPRPRRKLRSSKKIPATGMASRLLRPSLLNPVNGKIG
jgi:hypothetical protein